jgi:hypothetical protein
MTKTLIQKVKKGIKIATAITLIPTIMGCSTLPVEQEKNFPEGHINGIEYSSIDQNTVPYDLEEHVLFGERYYFQKRDYTSQGTLPFKIWNDEDVTRELDLDTNEATLISEKDYIPQRVEVEEYTKDEWADWITLRTNGPYGIKADMTSTNITEDTYGYSIITTEDNASFAIKTIKILDEEYFFPYVADNKTDEEGKLPYYLIPVKGAKIMIDNECGNLTIKNENQIYRPTLKIEEETQETEVKGD